MKDAQKPDHVSLDALVDRLREGRFVVPDFQREFEWKASDIRELVRSIFLDYYIGSLLLWKGKAETFAALSCESVYAFKGDGRPEYIVLDGQQRLTALYYAFFAPSAPMPNKAQPCFFFIRADNFMNEEYEEAFGYDYMSNRWAKLLESPEAQFASHIFPLSTIGAPGWSLPNWAQNYERYWNEKVREFEAAGDTAASVEARTNMMNAKRFGEHLRGITTQYQISYIELDKDLAIDKVCDIFTQINSRGIRLDAFDLINALLKPKGLQLKHMWREVAPRLSAVNTDRMNVYILQTMSILKQAYCSPKYLYYLIPGSEKVVREMDGSLRKDVLVHDIDEFTQLWNVAIDAIEGSIKVLQHPHEYGVTGPAFFPYVTNIPVFSALRAHIRSLPASRQLDAQRKLRHWYWASVFTNRYSGAVEATSTRDFLDMQAWFANDAEEPPLIAEFSRQFINLDLRRETKKGTTVYNGVFNLLVIQGARDWVTGEIPQVGDLDDHHIVPGSWGKKHLKNRTIDTILNRTPLTSDTNRNVIADRLPNSYLPELIRENGEDRVRTILESHLISPTAFNILLRDPFTVDDFEAFISERQRTIMDAIENLLIKERLDLALPLRELDEKIERVELDLRNVITTTLNDDPSILPQHIMVKVDERIVAALKKNAALDASRFTTLSGKLEYFDLRELQEAIVSKPLWPFFELRFGSKESLAQKFNQLAEVRNGIRHSRDVNQIARKEGEAAIMWFHQVLSK